MKTGLINHSSHFKACSKCNKRAEGCRTGCEDYAAEVILGILMEAEDKRNATHRHDGFAIAQQRAYRIAKRTPKHRRGKQGTAYMRSR